MTLQWVAMRYNVHRLQYIFSEFVMFSEPVILPPIVALDMLVALVSWVLMLCAFAEFRPTIAIMPIIAARIGMIKTNTLDFLFPHLL